jgi:two-component system LytT family response regulator
MTDDSPTALRRLRAIVVDDEPLSRRAMRQLLDARTDVEVVGEYESAVGLDAAASGADVLFLDIEMPVESGLALARRLANGGTAVAPFVVFVTAHEEYALPAFDASAVDYVTKPVAPARLARAIARVRDRVAAADPVQQHAAPAAAAAPPTSLIARVGAREVVVPLADVTLLQADGVYVAVHSGGRRHLVRGSLDEFERALGPAEFLRVHRSYLVRRSAIVETRLGASARRSELVLAGGTAVPVSRRRQAAVARAIRAASAVPTKAR